MPTEALLTSVAALLLAAAALHDIAARTIPNRLALCVATIGLALRLQSGDLATGVAAATLVFAAGFLAWRLGALGGGDVKLLAAAALLPPPALVPDLLVAVALCGGLLALLVLALRRLVPRHAAGPRPRGLVARALRAEAWRLRRRGPLPYAVAIAGGALLTLTA